MVQFILATFKLQEAIHLINVPAKFSVQQIRDSHIIDLFSFVSKRGNLRILYVNDRSLDLIQLLLTYYSCERTVYHSIPKMLNMVSSF